MDDGRAWIAQIWGEILGSGKTSTMVYLAYHAHIVLGRPVFSNIHLDFQAREPEPIEVILLRKYSNSVIALDELYQALEARGSQSGGNRNLTKELAMNRKRGNILLGTSPDPRYVDKRFSNIADFTIRTERFGSLNDRDATIRFDILARNIRSSGGFEHDADSFRVGDYCDKFNTKEEVQADRFAMLTGMIEIIREREDIIEKLKVSKLSLQKSYLNALFFITSSTDQLIVLDELGLL